MSVAHSVYICPLCGTRIRHHENPPRRNEDGSITYESPLGAALRIEAVLEQHFAVAHDLTPEQALAKLGGAPNTGTERDK